MANTYHQIYLQMVFAVKYRKAMLHKSFRNEVFGVMGNLIHEAKCKPLIVNGVEDHVHCLLNLRPAMSVSDVMQIVKGKSSKYINDQKLTSERFEWQRGYGVFSCHRSMMDTVYKYIERQETHHKVKTFKEEYTKLLADFQMEYYEEYIFQELE